MTSNIGQINTFTGGMDMDTDLTMVKADKYRYAENVRVITNDGGTTGVLQNIEGVREYTATHLPEDEVILGLTTVADIGIIITKKTVPNADGNYLNTIYTLEHLDKNDEEAGTLTLKAVCKAYMNLCMHNQNLCVVADYESSTNVHIYFTDGDSMVKTTNVRSDKFITDSKYIVNGILNDPNILDLTPTAKLAPPVFTGLTAGSLESGTVTYCYQLFHVRGSETVGSSLSPMIHLTSSNTSEGSQAYKGVRPDQNSNKAVKLTLNIGGNYSFDKCRLIRIHYKNNISLPTVVIVDEFDIDADNLTINYIDSGNAFLSELSVEEFAALAGYQFTAECLAKLQNRLFAANTTEVSWDPLLNGKKYDARAYRANSSGQVKLMSSSEDEKVFKLSALAEDSVDREYDCINPYNTAVFSETSATDMYVYKSDGKTYGGQGINIEYEFVTTDIKLSEQQQDASGRLDITWSMNVPNEYIGSFVINKQDGGKETDVSASDGYISRTPNYADPFIASKFMGYMRDEVYRFGIVFYNDKNIASPVYWIGDIRMPHAHQMHPFEYTTTGSETKKRLIGKALGIKFTVKNMPEEAIAYEIVRCDRTSQDRTVVVQAVGSYPYSYRILEQDDRVGKGSKLKDAVEMRPLPYFGNWFGGKYTKYAQNQEDDVATTEYWIQCAKTTAGEWTANRIYNNLIEDKYFRFVSPEICINGQETTELFEDNYTDAIGYYYSPFRNSYNYPSDESGDLHTGGVQREVAYYKAIFANVGTTKGAYGTNDQYNENIMKYCSFFTETRAWASGKNTWPNIVINNYLNEKHVGQRSIELSKYFVPHYTDFSSNWETVYNGKTVDSGTFGSQKATIIDAKYPPCMAYNVTQAQEVIANRVNVGNKTYTNYSMTDFTDGDNRSVRGPAGPCIIAQLDKTPFGYFAFSRPYLNRPNANDFWQTEEGPNAVDAQNSNQWIGESKGMVLKNKMPIEINKPADAPDLIQTDFITMIPACNIKKANVTQYGGNTYSSRSNAVYISTNSYSESSAKTNYVFGGDIYLSLLDYPNTMIFQMNDVKTDYAYTHMFLSYIPFESTVNMNLFQGCQAHRTYQQASNTERPTNQYMDSWGQLEPVQIGTQYSQNDPYYLYNTAYSARNTIKEYTPAGIYSESDSHTGTRIYASQIKTNNEVTDQWTKFRVADYLDVDNQYNDITNLKTFKDKLFYFQSNAVGIASINERSLITDDNSNSLVLGTGGILARYDYISNLNGNSIVNDKTIVSSDNVLYWYDFDKNELCMFNQAIQCLSKQKQVQTYFNSILKERNDIKDLSEWKPNAFYDTKYNEVWFRFLDKSLILNEQIGAFTGFYTFAPTDSLTFSDRIVAIDGNNLYSINDTDTDGEDNVSKDAYIQLIVNTNPFNTKVYDNTLFQGQFTVNGEPTIGNILRMAKYTTKNQTATLQQTLEKDIQIDYREDTYRYFIPRADVNTDEWSLPARMRGKYMVCDFVFDDVNFNLPQITTTFRYSNI